MKWRKYIEKCAREEGVSINELYRVLEGDVCIDIPETMQSLYDVDIDANNSLKSLAGEIVEVARIRKKGATPEFTREMAYAQSWIYTLFIGAGETKLRKTYNMSIKEYIAYLEWLDDRIDGVVNTHEKEQPTLNIAIDPDYEKLENLKRFLGDIVV